MKMQSGPERNELGVRTKQKSPDSSTRLAVAVRKVAADERAIDSLGLASVPVRVASRGRRDALEFLLARVLVVPATRGEHKPAQTHAD